MEHERLAAYRMAVELDALVARAASQAARGHTWLRDQALRASASVVLNVAEAVGRRGPGRARCARIARGSLFEVDAAMTLLVNRGACAPALRTEERARASRLVAMLTRFIAAARGR